jgi:mRNA-degrading endonuclease RelE of RelBE toxin-antitoxin system
MVLQYDFSEELKDSMKQLFKRDKQRYEILLKKIDAIVSSDDLTIEHYKNLRAPLNDRKRVHIDKSFVLTFRYDRSKKFILFIEFAHHDDIYQ